MWPFSTRDAYRAGAVRRVPSVITTQANQIKKADLPQGYVLCSIITGKVP